MTGKKLDVLLIFLLFLITAITRLILLEVIPPGLHGDEAWIGLWARQIIESGYIGVFSGDALGNPIGTAYVTALFFKIFGDSIFSIRLTTALFSITTVVTFYFFLRVFFDETASFLTSIVLSLSLMYLHYSRTGFMLTTSLFFQITTLIFIFKGRKEKKFRFILIGGFFAGLGMYTYNAYILFPLLIILLLIFDIILSKFRRIEIKKLIFFILVFLAVSFPLLKIQINEPEFYFQHFKTYSILNKEEVKDEILINQKGEIILKNGVLKLYTFFKGKKLDFADGFGEFYSFNYINLMLFMIGLVILYKHSGINKIFLLLSLILFIFSSFLTYDGTYRRTILSLPYLYFFMANAISYLIKKYKHLVIYLFALILLSSANNLQTYFLKFAQSQNAKWVFTYDLQKTIIELKNINYSNKDILFFSDRWSCNYETIKYLYPNLNCQDKSKEFGTFSLKGISSKNIIVLMGDYIPYFNDFKYAFPKGKERIIYDDNKIISIVYEI